MKAEQDALVEKNTKLSLENDHLQKSLASKSSKNHPKYHAESRQLVQENSTQKSTVKNGELDLYTKLQTDLVNSRSREDMQRLINISSLGFQQQLDLTSLPNNVNQNREYAKHMKHDVLGKKLKMVLAGQMSRDDLQGMTTNNRSSYSASCGNLYDSSFQVKSSSSRSNLKKDGLKRFTSVNSMKFVRSKSPKSGNLSRSNSAASNLDESAQNVTHMSNFELHRRQNSRISQMKSVPDGQTMQNATFGDMSKYGLQRNTSNSKYGLQRNSIASLKGSSHDLSSQQSMRGTAGNAPW